jgi:hypothetical protein
MNLEKYQTMTATEKIQHSSIGWGDGTGLPEWLEMDCPEEHFLVENIHANGESYIRLMPRTKTSINELILEAINDREWDIFIFDLGFEFIEEEDLLVNSGFDVTHEKGIELCEDRLLKRLFDNIPE